TNVKAVDNCDSNPQLSFSETKVAGNCAGSYSLKRTWTATDNCGNTASATQTVTVRDTTNPNLVGVPDNTTVACDTIPGALTVTATDNCDVNPTVKLTETRTSGACVNKVKTVITRTWTATDACGNSSSASQTITVMDTTAPVITCSGDIAV